MTDLEKIVMEWHSSKLEFLRATEADEDRTYQAYRKATEGLKDAAARLLAAATHEADKSVPYPEFCSQKAKCAGHSYCQREICCAD